MKKELIKILIDKYTNYSEKTLLAFIKEGKVIVNGEKSFLPFMKFEITNLNLELLEPKKYVSRGAFKLVAAIEKFNLKLNNLVCLDIGSSTGGFVQVLLENNAKKVYAVDVGTNQLDYSLRNNPKVAVYEKTNLKDLTTNFFKEQIEFITCDVSFISTKYVFQVSKDLLQSGSKLMILIKPQFEAPSFLVLERGIVEQKHHERIIKTVIEYAKNNHFKFINAYESPITGQKSKNIEYISLFERE